MNDAVAGPEAVAPLSQAEIRTVLIGMMLAMLLAALDQTIVATALPTIGRELGDVEHLPWVVTAYLLTSTAVTPLYGKFSDIHGRRPTLLIGIAIFVVGSVACALAPNMLIADRGARGAGARRRRADLRSRRRSSPTWSRRASAAATRPISPRVRDVEPGRPGARRLLRRAPALVDDLLDQRAARPRSPSC